MRAGTMMFSWWSNERCCWGHSDIDMATGFDEGWILTQLYGL